MSMGETVDLRNDERVVARARVSTDISQYMSQKNQERKAEPWDRLVTQKNDDRL
jgi:hypothetical protein